MGFLRVALALLFGLWFVSAVSAGETVWYDSTRHRSVLVKIYFPRSTEKAPIILFSHGIGSSNEECAYLAKAWTAQGFVCVLVQHPGSDENIKKRRVRILNEYRSAYEQNWSSRTRAKDLCFVLDCLEQLVQSHPQYAARLDMDKVGVGGIDLGALAALLLAGQVPPDYGSSLHDSRVKAVLALSPPVHPMNIDYREMYQPITAPTLFITGTKDDSIVGSTKAVHRRIPFDTMDQCRRYLITFDGGDHRIYGGRAVSFVGGRDDEKFQWGIVRASTCFWLAVLQEKPWAIQAMDSYGWASLVGVLASVERRSASPTLLGGGSSMETTQANLSAE
jgi:predicted dienelactone hydrolase